ncbi:MAG: sulfate transporter CysZ [Candidatus Thiodiazotropha sp.]
MSNNPLAGVGYLLKGLSLLPKPGIRPFVLIPLLVNIVVFSLLIWLGITQFEQLMEQFLPANGSWLAWLRWLLWPLFAMTVLLLVFYSFTLIANLIAAPFNSLLAEKIEAYLGGEPPKQQGGAKQMMKELLPLLYSEINKLTYFLLRAIPLLILFFIPGVNIVAPFLWMLFSAWYLAIEYGDYPMGNHHLSFKEQHRRLKLSRLTSLTFGGSLTAMMMVPVLNFIAMPAAVAGATIFWREQLQEMSDH